LRSWHGWASTPLQWLQVGVLYCDCYFLCYVTVALGSWHGWASTPSQSLQVGTC
jgi:hypothetical protein